MAELKTDDNTDGKSLEIIKAALSEAQTSVRAFDTKAQIVGVGYVFALGVVGGKDKWFPQPFDNDLIAVLIFWAAIMLPLFMFAFVLYPSRKTAPVVEEKYPRNLEHVVFINTERHMDIGGLKTSLRACDPLDEYAYEVLRVSNLRDLKRKRFIRALIAAAFSFVIQSSSQIIGQLAMIIT